MLPRFAEMSAKWSPKGYAFVIVYILEAHAVDEWPVSQTPRDVRQHRNLSDRLVAARDFLQEGFVPAGISLFADGDGNPFNEAYKSWPFRFWAITKDCQGKARVAFKPMPTNATYDVEELERWFEVEDAKKEMS